MGRGRAGSGVKVVAVSEVSHQPLSQVLFGCSQFSRNLGRLSGPRERGMLLHLAVYSFTLDIFRQTSSRRSCLLAIVIGTYRFRPIDVALILMPALPVDLSLTTSWRRLFTYRVLSIDTSP